MIVEDIMKDLNIVYFINESGADDTKVMFEPENVKNFLDRLIAFNRQKRGDVTEALTLLEATSENSSRIIGLITVDALQSLRVSLFGELCPKE